MGMTLAELDALNKADLDRRMGKVSKTPQQLEGDKWYKDKGYSDTDIARFNAADLKRQQTLNAESRASKADIALGDVGRYNAETGGLTIYGGEDKNNPMYWYNPKTNTTTYNGQKLQGRISPDVIEAMAPAMDTALKGAYDEYIGQAEKTPDKFNVAPGESEDWLGQGATSENFGNWQNDRADMSQASLDAQAMSKAMSNLNKGYQKNEYLQGMDKDFWGQFKELNTGTYSGK